MIYIDSGAEKALQVNPANHPIEFETITASKFREGDQVRFNWAGMTMNFTVNYVDSKFAYLRAMLDQTSQYRVSLRSSELRHFDRLGWTLMEGFFDQHTPITKAIS